MDEKRLDRLLHVHQKSVARRLLMQTARMSETEFDKFMVEQVRKQRKKQTKP